MVIRKRNSANQQRVERVGGYIYEYLQNRVGVLERLLLRTTWYCSFRSNRSGMCRVRVLAKRRDNIATCRRDFYCQLWPKRNVHVPSIPNRSSSWEVGACRGTRMTDLNEETNRPCVLAGLPNQNRRRHASDGHLR